MTGSLTSMTSRLGLLGGTFDPPHVGHLVVAECARVELGLDETRLLVAGAPWMKAPPTDAGTRLELVELAVAGSDGLVADGRETRRGGPTHTIETLEELAAEHPDAELVFLLGADAAGTLPDWHRAGELANAARFVVVGRPGADADVVGGVSGRLEVPAIDISSSELRERYRDGRATRHLVPPAVDDRIRALGLYGARRG
jgi:nicotinate-nucleotide adenylyltransferase